MLCLNRCHMEPVLLRRFWMNGSNPKRMYVMENVRDFVALHNLQAGSTLSFYYAPENRLVNIPVLVVYLQSIRHYPAITHARRVAKLLLFEVCRCC